MIMNKAYKIKFKEFDKDEAQEMEVRTKDIDFTVEQLGRNRHIETIDVKEITRYQENFNDNILGKFYTKDFIDIKKYENPKARKLIRW